MQKNNYGRDVELQICRYIVNEGMKILARNYTVKGGETDIIAIDGEYICFIDGDDYVSPYFLKLAEALA